MSLQRLNGSVWKKIKKKWTKIKRAGEENLVFDNGDNRFLLQINELSKVKLSVKRVRGEVLYTNNTLVTSCSCSLCGEDSSLMRENDKIKFFAAITAKGGGAGSDPHPLRGEAWVLYFKWGKGSRKKKIFS